MIGGVCIAQGAALDLEKVMPIMANAFADEYGEAWTLSQCSGIMALPGTWLLISRTAGIINGFALSRTIMEQSELMLLAVDPSAQGLGIGKLLLGRVVNDAAKAGATSLHVEVRMNNPALEFYLRQHFKRVGQRSNYYRGRQGQLTDAITLSYSIE